MREQCFFVRCFAFWSYLISRIVGEGLPLPQSHKISFVLILQNGGNSTLCSWRRACLFNKKGETFVPLNLLFIVLSFSIAKDQ